MKCICCNRNVISLINKDLNEEETIFKREVIKKPDGIITLCADNEMWDNGIVGTISAGYGSNNKDGMMIVIGICEECADNKIQSGSIAVVDNYMGGYLTSVMTGFKRIWKRANNIDKLLNGDE